MLIIKIRNFFKFFATRLMLLGVPFSIAGCITEGGVFQSTVYTQPTSEVPANLDDLGSLFTLGNYQPRADAEDSVNNVRRQALEDTALTVGAQAGLAARARQINSELQASAGELDRIFNFNALLLENNVLPPVILEGQGTLNLDNTDTIRIVNRTFRIAKQARFVTTPPNWRQYIWLEFPQPQAPHPSLLPADIRERLIWNDYVAQGWDNGNAQADSIFAENLARLKEDYVGMLTYNRLLAQNMVSAPFVANADLGVTGDSNQINIDDRILRITAFPGLTTDSSVWNPAVSNEQVMLEIDESLQNIIDLSLVNP